MEKTRNNIRMNLLDRHTISDLLYRDHYRVDEAAYLLGMEPEVPIRRRTGMSSRRRSPSIT